MVFYSDKFTTSHLNSFFDGINVHRFNSEGINDSNFDSFFFELISSFKRVVKRDSSTKNGSGFTLTDKVSLTDVEAVLVFVD